jgi:hypothetical protein
MSSQKVPSITDKAQLQSLPADIPEREKEDCPGYWSQMERRGISRKAGFLILRLLSRTLSWPSPDAPEYPSRRLMWTWQGRVKMSNPFPMGNAFPQVAKKIAYGIWPPVV